RRPVPLPRPAARHAVTVPSHDPGPTPGATDAVPQYRTAWMVVNTKKPTTTTKYGTPNRSCSRSGPDRRPTANPASDTTVAAATTANAQTGVPGMPRPT